MRGDNEFVDVLVIVRTVVASGSEASSMICVGIGDFLDDVEELTRELNPFVDDDGLVVVVVDDVLLLRLLVARGPSTVPTRDGDGEMTCSFSFDSLASCLFLNNPTSSLLIQLSFCPLS